MRRATTRVASSERFKVKADPYGSCYYDAAFMLKDAIEKVGTDPEKLRDWFAGVKGWKGVTNTLHYGCQQQHGALGGRGRLQARARST